IDTGETGVSLNPQANNVEILYKLKAVDLQENKSDFSETVTFNQSGGSQDKIAQNPAAQGTLPNEFTLYQNHPNPFNPITTIQFALPEPREVEIAVYNLAGQKIAVLASGVMEAGFHQTTWDGKDQQGNPASSGVYLYQLKAGNQRLVKKMMLIR
ncbi:MAG: T9SS type A sorting domain-containing protein, partial [Calditrichaceae bacterium]|nr:T9SS type A sorting domain-containing protein [Calditrichaceae bacterium]